MKNVTFLRTVFDCPDTLYVLKTLYNMSLHVGIFQLAAEFPKITGSIHFSKNNLT